MKKDTVRQNEAPLKDNPGELRMRGFLRTTNIDTGSFLPQTTTNVNIS